MGHADRAALSLPNGENLAEIGKAGDRKGWQEEGVQGARPRGHTAAPTPRTEGGGQQSPGWLLCIGGSLSFCVPSPFPGNQLSPCLQERGPEGRLVWPVEVLMPVEHPPARRGLSFIQDWGKSNLVANLQLEEGGCEFCWLPRPRSFHRKCEMPHEYVQVIAVVTGKALLAGL